MNTLQQLEFGLERAPSHSRPLSRASRQSRAQWWFRQMRAAVSQALDLRPLPPVRPQQVWLTLPAGRRRSC